MSHSVCSDITSTSHASVRLVHHDIIMSAARAFIIVLACAVGPIKARSKIRALALSCTLCGTRSIIPIFFEVSMWAVRAVVSSHVVRKVRILTATKLQVWPILLNCRQACLTISVVQHGSSHASTACKQSSAGHLNHFSDKRSLRFEM